MSLGLFGLALIGGLVGLLWKPGGRLITTAVVALLLGLVTAGSGGELADLAGDLVGWIRDGLNSLGEFIFGGEDR